MGCRGLCPPCQHARVEPCGKNKAKASEPKYHFVHFRTLLHFALLTSYCPSHKPPLTAAATLLPSCPAVAVTLLRSRSAAAVAATPRKARCQKLVAAPRGIGGMAGPAGPAHGEPSAPDGGEAADAEEGRDGRRVVPDGDRRVALVHVARRNHASQIHHDSKKAHCQLWTGDPGQHSPHTPYHPEAAMASRWHGSRHGPAMPPQVVTRGRWEGGREKK